MQGQLLGAAFSGQGQVAGAAFRSSFSGQVQVAECRCRWQEQLLGAGGRR